MPTTSRVRLAGLDTWLPVNVGTMLPDEATKLTCVPTASAGEAKPSATAAPSVSTTSFAASEAGIQPAVRVGRTLEPPSGGSDTSSPGLRALGPAARGLLGPKVPVIPIWPYAART